MTQETIQERATCVNSGDPQANSWVIPQRDTLRGAVAGGKTTSPGKLCVPLTK